ncbi:hypothetical protein CO058_02035 [candidate division WWE3 bacterium CG_4_9_14_0_2_um_filter_35_11]|uniref:Prepilin-type N-terminal cleavage/methylation domain-containing protein n=1 Tax=candidate division WWE3 bacterium CG_4_9_14_0_2_um_filter_35_11 TaxID=1975077 RepID=A0A2M8ELW0_UNCKA|nr:MAG: hypothetical protein COV25_03315 [candidate division WWE3 bacterium CG10_big_fil_rev_8_21_14_0_10_35_32]PJC23718.1 MAG: hypothetical protein CO058_02035 [candidate division WWE3 bacterium CG_4_9_14_0_2_um_filter_35_11]
MEIRRSGFTIIEAMIYITISGVLLLAILYFFSDSIFHQKRLDITSATLNDASILMNRLNTEIRNSVGVYSSTSSDICLINNQSVYLYGSTRISFSNNSVLIGRSSDSDCSPLGTVTSLNSNLSQISSLSFDHIAKNYGDIVTYDISFTSPSVIAKSGLPGEDSNYTYSSSITIRSW